MKFKLFVVFAFAILLPAAAIAQTPPVPPEFQDLSTSLNNYLAAFNNTLNATPVSGYPLLATGNLKNANGNAGPNLVNPGAMTGIQLQLQELKAMGVKAVMVEVGFPLLYQPFLTAQGQSYSQFAAFYQQVAQSVRAAGLKLIVENDTLLSNDVQAGWNTAPFYATLNWTEYQQARAQNAVTVAQTLQPDYLVVVEEPTTEANNTGMSEANTPSGSASLLSEILASVQQSGVSGMKVGAGTSTAQSNFQQYIQSYAALPVDFIDMHVYPINKSYLPNALQIASAASAAGKPVGMSECGLWKVRDSELGVLTPDEIRARDPYDFWPPLDSYFIQTMQNLGAHTQMLFINPFNTEMFSAYLPYDSSTSGLSPSQILSQESAQAAQNMGEAMFTSTALSYYSSLAAPPDKTPPTVPSGVAGGSNGATTAYLSWSASTDNIGVAGYNVLRNGEVVATTASLYYQDSALTGSTTYTYTVEAFDLAPNTSAASARVNITTADTTPPAAPTKVSAIAASSQRISLTWAPSTDNVAIGSYIVFVGPSPAALGQAGRVAATTTSYTSYPLTQGTTYYYAVEAADTSGNASPMSAVVSATTPMPPTPPTGVSAVALAATKVTVAWSPAAAGGLPIQYYHVFRGTSASNLVQVAILSQTSYTDNTVTQAATYYYGVETSDTGADQSVMSTVVSVHTPAPPAAPTDLVAMPVSDAKIGLTWSASASGGLAIQNYHIYRGTTSANMAQLSVVLVTSYTDSTASPGATYYYAVQSADTGADLSPTSQSVRVTVPSLPSAPTGLVATAPSATKVSLTWIASAGGVLAIRNYQVFRGTSASTLTPVATVTLPSYTDTSVAPVTKYYYAVEASDTGGDVSPMSLAVSVTTP